MPKSGRENKREHHGMSHTSVYSVYRGILRRCLKETDPAYKMYGGAGILVCDEWLKSFAAFYEHIGPRPTPSHSIDRIDGSKGYEPGNVRWATPQEQSENRRTTRFVTIGGESHSVSYWARRNGIPLVTCRQRLRHPGWTMEEAVTIPPRAAPHIRGSFTRMDEETAREIRRVAGYGIANPEIARLFNLTSHAVRTAVFGSSRRKQCTE